MYVRNRTHFAKKKEEEEETVPLVKRALFVQNGTPKVLK